MGWYGMCLLRHLSEWWLPVPCVTSYIPCSGDSLARLETKHEMHLNCSNADFGTCPKHSCALSRMPMHDSCQTMQLTWSWPVLRLIWCTHAHMCIEFCSSSRICSMYVAWTTSTNNVQATSNALLKECFFCIKIHFLPSLPVAPWMPTKRKRSPSCWMVLWWPPAKPSWSTLQKSTSCTPAFWSVRTLGCMKGTEGAWGSTWDTWRSWWSRSLPWAGWRVHMVPGFASSWTQALHRRPQGMVTFCNVLEFLMSTIGMDIHTYIYIIYRHIYIYTYTITLVAGPFGSLPWQN